MYNKYTYAGDAFLTDEGAWSKSLEICKDEALAAGWSQRGKSG